MSIYNLRIKAVILSFMTGTLVYFTSTPPAQAEANVSAGETRGTTKISKSSEVIGLPVYDRQNQRVGTLKDILYNLETGRAPLAVIASESGPNQMTIPLTACTFRPSQRLVQLNVDKDRLQNLPSGPAVASQESFSANVLPMDYDDYPRGSAKPREVDEMKRVQAGYTSREQDEYANELLRAQQTGRANARADSEVYRGSVVSPTITEPAGTQAPGTLLRTTDLRGMTVEDVNGETVGTLTDTVVDWSQGALAYGVIRPEDDADFHYYAVPPTTLRRSSSNPDVLVLTVDRDKLDSGPAYNPNNTPTPTERSFLDKVYQHYQQTPYPQSGRVQ